MDLERAEFLDPAQAVFLDVAGDDAGERAAQVGGQVLRATAVVQVQRASLGPLTPEVRTTLRGYETRQAKAQID